MSQDEKERWVPVTGANFRYYVSNHGNVKGVRGNVLSQSLSSCKRFKRVNIKPTAAGTMIKQEAVHVLVAEHFLERRPSANAVVKHKDGNGHNNNVSNLYWA